jgi:hypothetical protein
MNPFILSFKESPRERDIDFSRIKYCEKLNLSIDTQTGLPAISSTNLSTTTLTKVYNETSDSDNDFNGLLMGTMTRTQYQLEGTDEDASFKNCQNINPISI